MDSAFTVAVSFATAFSITIKDTAVIPRARSTVSESSPQYLTTSPPTVGTTAFPTQRTTNPFEPLQVRVFAQQFSPNPFAQLAARLPLKQAKERRIQQQTRVRQDKSIMHQEVVVEIRGKSSQPPYRVIASGNRAIVPYKLKRDVPHSPENIRCVQLSI